jgi:very-short-patch-repair endonuclease
MPTATKSSVASSKTKCRATEGPMRSMGGRGGTDMSLDRARELRRNQTDAEKRLWGLLRANRLGWKFKRQQPLGPFIADFICFEAWLVIEADGGQHGGCRSDEARDAWMQQRGYRVLRFWNNEVLGNLDGVAERICQALAVTPPSPRPSPARGEGASTVLTRGPTPMPAHRPSATHTAPESPAASGRWMTAGRTPAKSPGPGRSGRPG